MLSRVVFLVVLLWVSPARPDGLRGVAIGDDCAAAFESELARGSQPTRPLPEIQPNDLVSFAGSHSNRSAMVGYSCSEGVVSKQLILFKLPTEADAQAVFEAEYRALLDRFGTPCTDWRKLSLWHRFTLWVNGLYFPDILTSVDWDLGNGLQAKLDTTPVGPGPDYWSVSIGISGPPLIFVQDADGSERRVHTPIKCLHGG